MATESQHPPWGDQPTISRPPPDCDTAALVDSDHLQAAAAGDEGAAGREALESGHCHTPAVPPSNLARNQLIAVSVLCTLFMVAEIVGGVISGSLALVTDATHLACDLAGFLVSLAAIWLAKKGATSRMSFGYYRAEVVGALLSVLIIWLVTGVLVYLAVKRVQSQDYEIKPDEMLIVSACGVVFNIVMGIVLHSGICKKCQVHANFGHGHSHGGHSHDQGHSHVQGHDINDFSLHQQNNNSVQHTLSSPLPRSVSESEVSVERQDSVSVESVEVMQPEKKNINVRAAMVHVIGDLIQSIGVLIAAIIIKVKPEYKLADPICTFVFSVLVLFTTILVIRDVLLIFMEAVPRDVDYSGLRRELGALEHVRAAHSLHVWSLTVDKVAVAVHLAVDEGVDWKPVLQQASHLLQEKYHVHHSTVQVEDYHPIMASCEQCLGPAT